MALLGVLWSGVKSIDNRCNIVIDSGFRGWRLGCDWRVLANPARRDPVDVNGNVKIHVWELPLGLITGFLVMLAILVYVRVLSWVFCVDVVTGSVAVTAIRHRSCVSPIVPATT